MLSEIIAVFSLAIIVFIFSPLRRVFLPAPAVEKDFIFAGKRIEYFDFLKGVAILAVIITHIVYLSVKTLKVEDPLFLFTLNNLARFAIPFFLVISGILSAWKYENKINLGRYYLGKFLRVYLPFAFFTMLVLFLHGKDISDLFKFLVNGRVLTPYYFIILILQLYILFPLLRFFKDSRWFLVLSFFISLLFFSVNQLNYLGEVILFPSYLFFFVYGMYYRNNFIKYEADKTAVKYWGLIIFLYITISFILPAHYFNFRPFYGLAVFNLFFIYKDKIIAKLDNVYGVICDAGKNSLWIYFTHFSLLTGLFYLANLFTKDLYATVLIIFFVSLPLSYWLGKLTGWLYNKISYILKPKYGTEDAK